MGELTEKESKNCSSQYEFRTKIMINDTNDQLFYEFIIKLLIATLKKAFPASQENQETVAEEVSRLFRGNCFNSSKREHELLRHREKYPILKEDLSKNLNIFDTKKRYEFIEKMQDRAKIPKYVFQRLTCVFRQPFAFRQEYSPKGEIRPMFANLSSLNAASARSPLVSQMFPTLRDKIKTINRQVEMSAHLVSPSNRRLSKPRFLPSLELEKIVQHEVMSRHDSHAKSLAHSISRTLP